MATAQPPAFSPCLSEIRIWVSPRVKIEGAHDGVIGWVPIEGIADKPLILRARAVRMERGAVHARLGIQANGATLAWTNMNLEDDPQRVRLANSAIRQLPQVVQKVCTPRLLQMKLSEFCEQVWAVWNERFAAKMTVAGESEPIERIGPVMVKGGGTILFAPPGQTKSYVTGLMAVSIDAGCNSLFEVGAARKVMIVNLERSESSYARRLGLINEALGLSRTRGLMMLHARGRSLIDIVDSVRQSVVAHGIDVLVLDSISRAGFGKLVEDAPANRIMDALNGICESWLAIAHTPRDDAAHAFGSVMFDAAGDVMVQLTHDQDGLRHGVGLMVNKANDIQTGLAGVYGLRFDPEIGLVEAWRSDKREFPGAALEALTGKDKALEALDVLGEGDASEIAGQAGLRREHVSRYLRGAPGVNWRKDGKRTVFFFEEPHTRNGSVPV